jgi:hypothetical protein
LFDPSNLFHASFRQVAALRNVFADLSVQVLDSALLPRMVGVAEIYLDPEEFFQLFMLPKENVVVGGEGLPFGKPLLDSRAGLVHVLDGHRINLLKERVAALAVDEGEEGARPRLARDDEVAFQVSDPASVGYGERSFIDEGAVGEHRALRSFPANLLLVERFDPSSVGTLDEPPNTVLGDVREHLFGVFQSARNGLGRLAFEKMCFYKVPKLRMQHNFHPLELGVLSSDRRFVLGFLRIVAPFDPIAFQFVGKGGDAAVHALADLAEGAALLAEDEQLFPFGGGEVPESGTLFFIVFSKRFTLPFYPCSDSNGKVR